MTKIEPCYKKLGKIIKMIRLEHHLTSTVLARKVGISRPALSNIEDGRQRIYLHHLLKLEKVFQIDLVNEVRTKRM